MSKYPLILSALSLCFAIAACGSEPAEESTVATAQGEAREAPAAKMPRNPSPEGARVFFIKPADGDTVSNPVVVEFGVEGMKLLRAGDKQPQSGHHHLIVDAGLPDLSLPIPSNDHYVHFGDARTVTELTLEPGTHTLQMLLGDYLHIPHDPPLMSKVISITVE